MRIELPIKPNASIYGYEAPNQDILVADRAQSEIITRSNSEFLARTLGATKSIAYLSRSSIAGVDSTYKFESDATSLAVMAVHQCFDQHIGLTLAPDLLWYMIVHEVAAYVKANTRQYAHLFTSTPDQRQTIVVRGEYTGPNDWPGLIQKVRQPLMQAVTDRTMSLFLPRFSTATPESETTLLVAFMDTVSPYYGFEWRTCCGIPAVELQGTSADWSLLLSQTEELMRAFPSLEAYFVDLIGVLAKIADTASGGTVDESFWTSIYKWNGGSGGPYVNGWLTAFFAHRNTYEGPQLRDDFGWENMARRSFSGLTTDEFPSHISKVPFRWIHLDQPPRDMAFAAGILGVDNEGGSLAPKLGYAVLEL